jgi:hypothetical protein
MCRQDSYTYCFVTGLLGGISVLIALAGCRQAGFTRIDEGVYISKPLPALERAAEAMSTARRDLDAAGGTGSALPVLSVSITSDGRLGPEDFRIQVDEKAIVVEGGGPAGALYGGFEVSRRIRAACPVSALVVTKASPSFPNRILMTDLEIPGLVPAPRATDWPLVLDRVALGRFNHLLVEGGDFFPALVSLKRFPKAFVTGASEMAPRRKAFQDFLDVAQARSVGLIVMLTDLTIPESFSRTYAEMSQDGSRSSSLGQAFLRECIAQFLRAYPQVSGVAVRKRALSAISEDTRENFVHSVFVQGIRAGGRIAILYLEAEVGSALAKIRPQPGIKLLTQVDLSPALAATPDLSPRSAGSSYVCGLVPVSRASPSWPSPAWSNAYLELARRVTPMGITVPMPGFNNEHVGSEYLLEREALRVSCFGLGAFQPAIENLSWVSMWRDLTGTRAEGLVRAASEATAIWPELALFHGGTAWAPLTSSEAAVGVGNTRDLRDDDPYVSVIELVFSPTRHPVAMSIPEFVASEVLEVVEESRRTPLEVADALSQRASACLEELAKQPAPAAAGALDFASAAALELEGMAHLGRFHAHRIRAGVFLTRHVAGVGEGAHDEAVAEITEAVASWSAAQVAFSRLIAAFSGTGSFPDLSAWRQGVDQDVQLVKGVRADPVGFRNSPLVTSRQPISKDFDYRRLRGVIDLGQSVLNTPSVELLDESQSFEAEEFVGNWSQLQDVKGYSGTGYVSSGLKGEAHGLPLTLRLRVHKPGIAYVWVRAVVGGGGEAPSVLLQARGGQFRPTHTTTRGDRRLVWEKAGEVNLTPGECFLQIADHAAGKEGVDAVVIAREGDWRPPNF